MKKNRFFQPGMRSKNINKIQTGPSICITSRTSFVFCYFLVKHSCSGADSAERGIYYSNSWPFCSTCWPAFVHFGETHMAVFRDTTLIQTKHELSKRTAKSWRTDDKTVCVQVTTNDIFVRARNPNTCALPSWSIFGFVSSINFHVKISMFLCEALLTAFSAKFQVAIFLYPTKLHGNDSDLLSGWNSGLTLSNPESNALKSACHPIRVTFVGFSIRLFLLSLKNRLVCCVTLIVCSNQI